MISAASSNLLILAAAVAPPATPPTITTFMSFHLSPICGHAADVVHIFISHALQQAYCLAASGPGLAIDEQGRLFLLRNGCDFFNLLQRQVPASWNMSSPILFGGADVQQDCLGDGPVLLHALIDVRLPEQVKESHMATSYSIPRMALLGLAPMAWLTTFPSFITTKVGMLMTRNCPASSGSSSTLTLPTLMSERSLAISSTMGTTIRQGPHQGAQKSSSTGLSESMTSLRKLFLLILTADILSSSFVFLCGSMISWISLFFCDDVT